MRADPGDAWIGVGRSYHNEEEPYFRGRDVTLQLGERGRRNSAGVPADRHYLESREQNVVDCEPASLGRYSEWFMQSL